MKTNTINYRIELNGRIDLKTSAGTQEEITILIGGDFCPINRTEKAILEGRSLEIISQISSVLHKKDISIINLETPLTKLDKPIKKIGPNLKGSPECVEFISKAGFDVANLANNHIRDFGDIAVTETIKLLENHNVASVGAGENLSDASKPLIIEKKGKKIAILSYAENEFTIADENSAGAAPLNPLKNIRQIREISASNDITIVLIHGGNEYCPIPSPRMIQTYREFAKAGASAIVATHTHCPQGIELVDGVPVVYSTGNFLFDMPYADKVYSDDDLWWKGYMVRITFSGRTTALVEIIPYNFGPDGTKIKLMCGSERDNFLLYLAYISNIIKDESEMKNIWYAWCVMNGPSWIDYFKKAQYPVDITDTEAYRNIMVLRNGFTCEAHNEVIKTFLRIICEGKTAIAEKYINKIKRLQKGIFA